jgi:hypothetical protein
MISLRFLARTRRAERDERGGALVLVLIVGVLLLAAGSVIIGRTGTEGKLADRQSEYEGALHAAEAGVHDYIAKLTEDRIYFRHRVHPAEDTRTRVSPLSGTVGPDTAWPGDSNWTYPATRLQFQALKGGTTSQYEYNLRITPSTGGPVTITATGRRRDNPRVTRTLEVLVKGSSIADYQAIYDQGVTYGATATTTGRIYSTGSIDYRGTASADVIAEGSITDGSSPHSAVMIAPARRCDSGSTYGCSVRTAVTNPISFASFTASFDEIKRVAQSSSLGGIYLNDVSKTGWRLTFNTNGTVKIESCTSASNLASGTSAPTCTTTSTPTVPALGVIYTEQPVIVLGSVKGRVTVASSQDIIIGGPIDYVDPSTDVIGLLAKVNVFVAEYAPNTFTWKGAILAQTGAIQYWGSPILTCNGQKHTGTMTFVGSWASKQGACMATSDLLHGYTTRVYNYDPNLSNLQPPFLPVLEEAYKILRYREVDS